MSYGPAGDTWETADSFADHPPATYKWDCPRPNKFAA